MLLRLFLLVWALHLSLQYTVVKQVTENIFETHYEIHDTVTMKTNLLIISCKESQVLSLMVLPLGKSAQENPRYDIYRPKESYAYKTTSYTFYNNCRVDIDVKSKDSIVVVKRKNSTEILFEITKVVFDAGHHTIETV